MYHRALEWTQVEKITKWKILFKIWCLFSWHILRALIHFPSFSVWYFDQPNNLQSVFQETVITTRYSLSSYQKRDVFAKFDWLSRLRMGMGLFCFAIISPEKMVVYKLNHFLYPRFLYTKFDWNLPNCSGEISQIWLKFTKQFRRKKILTRHFTVSILALLGREREASSNKIAKWSWN